MGGVTGHAEPTPSDFPAPAAGPVVDIATAPVIVVGIAGESQSVYFKDEGIVRTFTTFEVESVERGGVTSGSQITISALGGETPELIHFSEHQPIFTKGERSRLFLRPNEKIQGVYRVFGLDQGKQDDPTTVGIAKARFSTAEHVCGQGYCLNHIGPWAFTQQPVGYKVNPNTPDLPNEAEEVQAGFNTWERSDSRMDFHYLGTTAIASAVQDGVSVVFWNTVQGEYCGTTNWGACWHAFPPSEFDVDYNEAIEWTDVEGNNDVQSTAVHEAGHALGLDHVVGDCGQVLGTVDEDTGCPDQQALGQGDINGVTALYPANVWHLRNINTAGPPTITPFGYGSASWVPLKGDWDGNGSDTPGVFVPPNIWILNNAFDGTADVPQFKYGPSSGGIHIPVVGDWDSDGDDTPGIIFGTQTTWYLNNQLQDPNADITPFVYGNYSMTFVAGNWDGIDGCSSPSLICGDTPGAISGDIWLLNNNFDTNNSGSGGVPDVPSFDYGDPTDVKVVGNWDNADGCAGAQVCWDTPGVWRSTQSLPNFWYLNNGFDANVDVPLFAYGRRGNQLAGDWDGDGDDTIGVR